MTRATVRLWDKSEAENENESYRLLYVGETYPPSIRYFEKVIWEMNVHLDYRAGLPQPTVLERERKAQAVSLED